MLKVAPGAPASLVIDLGQALPARWRLIDATDASVVADWAPAPAPLNGAVTLAVAAEKTQLQAGQAGRILTAELEVTAGSESFILTADLAIIAVPDLSIPGRSFQTWAAAAVLAQQSLGMEGWTAASKENQQRALAAAHMNILRLRLGVLSESGVFSQSDWDALEPADHDAFKRAQLIEANHLLTDDPEGNLRRAGIVSMTVGESSQFFKSVRPIELGVCREAYTLLAPYLRRGMKIQRA